MGTRAQEWMEAALEWGKTAENWFAVRTGSPEETGWAKYFQGQGFAPWAFRRMARNEAQEWTAPCQWPEWFPGDWEARRIDKPKLRMVEGRK